MNRFILSISFMLVAMTACSVQEPVQITQQEPATKLPKQFAERQILVTLPDATKPQWKFIAEAIGKEYEIALSGEFPLTSIAVNCLVYKVPEQLSMMKLLNQLRADERIVWAQENFIFQGLQGGSDAVYASLSYGPKLIKAPAAHRLTTGAGVKIAVIDTGADLAHPDLQGNMMATANFVEGGKESFAEDIHGTAVAGIIAAHADNGMGIDGIAPNAEIIVMKSCWYDGHPSGGAKCSSWSLAKAIDAAINKTVNIINLSLAGPDDRLLDSLLFAAHQRDIVIVTASLDKRKDPGFPASLRYVIPAISVTPSGSVRKPDWLQQLPAVVAAPGVEVVTTVPRGGYGILSGTSMAAAHISGVVALMLEYQPTLKPQEIKRLLTEDTNTLLQTGALDVCKVLKKIDNGKGC